MQKTLAPCVALCLAALIATSAPPAHAQAAACQATPAVKDQTTLRELSSIWFGDPSFRFAILLATNARAADPRFGYLANPNQLVSYTSDGTRKGPRAVCIPALDEALRLRNRFARYMEAVNDMALAEPSEIVSTLDPVPADGPIRVVSWVRADQAAALPAAGGTHTTGGATWVTLDPHVRDFCTAYTTAHSDDPTAVTLRLEQRLGLPPAASKTHFVTFELARVDQSSIFRPCADTETSDQACTLGPPKACADGDAICTARRDFFFQQYYGSYGGQRPVEYPWTSLGYTFDWAPAAPGLGSGIGFVTVGESEYVIPGGVDLTVVAIEPTMAFCTR
ncbi:MAG: hypothetical protein AAGK00_01135 [Pseudomonadota bacterium]